LLSHRIVPKSGFHFSVRCYCETTQIGRASGKRQRVSNPLMEDIGGTSQVN